MPKIQEELEKSSERYHIIGVWVAIFADPLFAITDYINIPEAGHKMLVIRILIALTSFTILKLRVPLKIKSSAFLAFVPFLLISLQNAYTFSLISSDNILGHCLNYMALFIGGGMFILWRWQLSAIIISSSGLATSWFIYLNPNIIPEKFLLNGGLLLISVGAFMFFLIRTRYNLTIKEITARLLVEEINDELTIQKNLVEEKNKNITSSIRYAKRIQNAILGDKEALKKYFSDFFVLFEPKDILSGDFYWFFKNNEVQVIIAGDCTGHGVPGALTTVLGASLLKDIVVKKQIYSPDLILKELDKAILKAFSSDGMNEPDIDDGMDVSILTFQNDEVYFSAAKNPLYIVNQKEIKIIKGSPFPIGSKHIKKEKVFEKHIIKPQKDDKYYIFSDGYQDQIGEKINRKYYTKNFREFIIKNSHLSMNEQKEALKNELISWQGNKTQTDDILIIGISI